MQDLIKNFISTDKERDLDLFPYLANKKSFDPTKDTVYYSGPYWDDKEPTTIIESILKGKWLPAGEKVNTFEREFSKMFGFDKSIMVNSGSSANLVMLAALKKYYGWQDGDEIIVCCCGFATTIAPIIQNNLKPVFVDIDWKDLNWDIEQISSKITERTRAVFSSPVLGNSYDLEWLLDICETNQLQLISDNCDSLGSTYKGNFLTSCSVAASCSFYPAHHICTMEGGMVSSNIPDIVDLARSFAWWGRGCWCVGSQNKLPNGVCGKRFDNWLGDEIGTVDHKYVFGVAGYNLKPLDLQGAVGSVQLRKFDEIHNKRRINKATLDSIFEKVDGLRIVNELEEAETSWFGVPIICRDKKQKTALVKHLEDNRVQTRNYFAGNILQHPGYRHLGDASKYAKANQVLDKVFFVGCSPTITEEMIDYVDSVVTSFEYE